MSFGRGGRSSAKSPRHLTAGHPLPPSWLWCKVNSVFLMQEPLDVSSHQRNGRRGGWTSPHPDTHFSGPQFPQSSPDGHSESHTRSTVKPATCPMLLSSPQLAGGRGISPVEETAWGWGAGGHPTPKLRVRKVSRRRGKCVRGTGWKQGPVHGQPEGPGWVETRDWRQTREGTLEEPLATGTAVARRVDVTPT